MFYAVMVISCSTLKSPDLSLQLLTSPAALTYQVCSGPQMTCFVLFSLPSSVFLKSGLSLKLHPKYLNSILPPSLGLLTVHSKALL